MEINENNSNRELKEFIKVNNPILDLLFCSILIVDAKGILIYCNPMALRVLRRSREEIIGKDIEEVNPNSLLREALKTGKSYRNRQIKLSDDVSVLSSGTVIKKNNRVIGAVAVFQSLDELKEAILDELKIEQEINQELSAIIESSYDGIWICDGEGVTLHVNKSYEEFAGIKKEEVIGRSLYDLVEEGYVTDSASLHVIEKKKPVTLVHEIKTGKKAMVTATPIFNKEGEIWRIITNVRDISLIESMREEIERLKKESQRVERELKQLRKENLNFEIIGSSKALEDVISLSKRVAQVDTTALILGESGVGKDLIARLIHKWSPRRERAFIKINCGAIPENLLESELFGYEKGSFTGASKSGKPGMFELADKGTLFLDEIGEISLKLQVKLLQAIQEQQIYRVGGIKPINLDVRIIAATNQDLESMVKKGTFRKDLYYRLNVVPIKIPPLRERKEDIPILIEYFLDKYNKKFKDQKKIDQKVIEHLCNYQWPGNIRELENVIENLVILVRKDTITVDDLPKYLRMEDTKGLLGNEKELYYSFLLPKETTLEDAVKEVEKKLISEALNKGSSRQAARKLKVDQSTVVRKARKYNINWHNKSKG